MKTDSWWINAGDYDGIECEDVQQTVPDEELLETALVSLKIAKQKADSRKDALAMAMNFVKYDGVESRILGRNEYKWLRPSGDESYSDLKAALLYSYEHFQRISVGIQKALEHSKDDVEIVDVLTATKDDLRAVLTEVQRALFEKNIPTEGRNVTENVIPRDVIVEDESSRCIYNLTVFKHYLEALEHTIKELERYKNRIS